MRRLVGLLVLTLATFAGAQCFCPGGTFALAKPTKLTAQGADVSATTFTGFSSVVAGYYRVCGYASVTRAATTSSTLPGITMTCTDPADSVAKTVKISATNTGNTTGTAVGGCGICDAKVSTAVQYGTSGWASSGGTSMQFDVIFTLELL